MFVERWVSYSLCKQKNDIIQGADELVQNNITFRQANHTGVPPSQKSKQSRLTNLSLYKHWNTSVRIHNTFLVTNKWVQ